MATSITGGLQPKETRLENFHACLRWDRDRTARSRDKRLSTCPDQQRHQAIKKHTVFCEHLLLSLGSPRSSGQTACRPGTSSPVPSPQPPARGSTFAGGRRQLGGGGRRTGQPPLGWPARCQRGAAALRPRLNPRLNPHLNPHSPTARLGRGGSEQDQSG